LVSSRVCHREQKPEIWWLHYKDCEFADYSGYQQYEVESTVVASSSAYLSPLASKQLSAAASLPPE
jgi:hypothetical protein